MPNKPAYRRGRHPGRSFLPYPDSMPGPTGELALIQDLRRRFRHPSSRAIALGIGDDAAVLSPKPNHQIVITTDLLVEGRHFRRDTHTARSAGHRCLARGLSDLAAMGATPVAAFLSLALPRFTTATPAGRRWLAGFLDGLHALARRTQTPLAGGDTGESPTDHLLADIVLLGSVPSGQALTRSGAHPGDQLWVSGALGGAAAHLNTMLARATTHPRPSTTPGPQTHPEPRLALGQALLRRNRRTPTGSPATITACMDLSDGLSSDLRRLCEESRLHAEVDSRLLPIHPLATREPDALTLALSGGEDYELLFAASPSARLPRSLAGVPLTRIGTLLAPRRASPLVTLLDAHGHPSPLEPAGWEHLR